MKKIISLILVFTTLMVRFSVAQNFTGTWHGIMDNQYLQISINQKGNQICGFTYDYVIDDKESFCKAAFSGRYDEEGKAWYITGTKFLVNSGEHDLMRLKLWFVPGSTEMRARSVLKASFMSVETGEIISLQRVSRKPLPMPGNEAPCFPEQAKNKGNPAPTPKVAVPNKPPVKPQVAVPPKPKPTTPPVVTKPKPVPPPPPVVKKAEPKKNNLPVIKPTEAQAAKQIMESRKSVEQKKMVVTGRDVKIQVLDNGRIDNDSISVFYNGRLLMQHIKLGEKPTEIKLQLDENVTRHEITIVAENLGDFPPNTAYVIVTVGGKKFEMNTEQNLNQNAVLVFDYVPPK